MLKMWNKNNGKQNIYIYVHLIKIIKNKDSKKIQFFKITCPYFNSISKSFILYSIKWSFGFELILKIMVCNLSF